MKDTNYETIIVKIVRVENEDIITASNVGVSYDDGESDFFAY